MSLRKSVLSNLSAFKLHGKRELVKENESLQKTRMLTSENTLNSSMQRVYSKDSTTEEERNLKGFLTT